VVSQGRGPAGKVVLCFHTAGQGRPQPQKAKRTTVTVAVAGMRTSPPTQHPTWWGLQRSRCTVQCRQGSWEQPLPMLLPSFALNSWWRETLPMDRTNVTFNFSEIRILGFPKSHPTSAALIACSHAA